MTRKKINLTEQACKYITEKAYPEGCTQSRKRQIRKKAEKFRMVNGELYYTHQGRIRRYESLWIYREKQKQTYDQKHADPSQFHVRVYARVR